MIHSMLDCFLAVRGVSAATLKTMLAQSETMIARNLSTFPHKDAWRACDPAKYEERRYASVLDALNEIGSAPHPGPGYLLCRDDADSLYLFKEELARPRIYRFLPQNCESYRKEHDLPGDFLDVVQRDTCHARIEIHRDGTLTKRLVSAYLDCTPPFDTPFVYVEGPPLPDEGRIHYNRLRNMMPLGDGGVDRLCRHVGCIGPKSREFPRRIVETVRLKFQGGTVVPPDAEAWRIATSPPAPWTMTDEEWTAYQETLRQEDAEAEAEMQRVHACWLEFQDAVQRGVSAAAPGARPGAVIAISSWRSWSIRAETKARKPIRWVCDAPPANATPWSRYEEHFKSHCIGPTSSYVKMHAVDHQGNAYLSVYHKNDRRDHTSFETTPRRSTKLPMVLRSDVEKGFEGLFDLDGFFQAADEKAAE